MFCSRLSTRHVFSQVQDAVAFRDMASVFVDKDHTPLYVFSVHEMLLCE